MLVCVCRSLLLPEVPSRSFPDIHFSLPVFLTANFSLPIFLVDQFSVAYFPVAIFFCCPFSIAVITYVKFCCSFLLPSYFLLPNFQIAHFYGCSVAEWLAERPGFKSQSRRCRVTVSGKLFTPIMPCSSSSKIGSSPLKGCGGNCGPGGK